MTAFPVVLALAVGLCLSGCVSGTTFILMPDENGKVGAITVKSSNSAGELRVIDKAYHSVTVKDEASRLAETQALSEVEVNQEYADLLKAQPTKPSSFLLYFVSGSSELVEESIAIISQIVDRIKARMPTEISIIGHTDTTGSDNINDRLSLKRARAMEKMLKSRMPSLDGISVQSFGAKDLLVPTPPNVNEPRNRRVEVVIL